MNKLFLLFISFSLSSTGQNKQQTDSINFETHYKNAIKYYRASDYKKAIKEWGIAENFTESGYKKTKCMINTGVCYKLQSQYDSAFYYYTKAKETAIISKSNKLLGNINNNLGTLALRTGAYNKAQEHLLLALKYKKEENDSVGMGSTLLNLGEVQLRLENWKLAKDYYLKSLKIREQVADSFGIASSFVNLGILEKKKNQFKKAENYYSKALKLCDSGFGNKTKIQLIVLENMGELYVKENKTHKALSAYRKALVISEAINSLFDVAFCKNGLALIKLKQNKPIEALKLGIEAYSIAKDSNILEAMDDYSMTISKAYEAKKDYENAIKWSRRHELLKDSILNIDKIRETQGMEYEYQTLQKETKILRLSNQNNEQKAQLAHSQLLNILGASSLIILSGLGLFFWQRKKQEQTLLLLSSKIRAGEEEKKRIGRELHDGIAGSLIKLVHDTEGEQQNISEQLLKTYNDVRNISHQLDNTPIHGELFIERLYELIPKNRNNQIFTIKIIPNHLTLIEPYGTHVYRIIQELISNNIKYAKASKTNIKITKTNKQLSISYNDNGIGINNSKKGNGFRNIEERIILMKGTLHLSKDDNKGLKLDITIPYQIITN